jgi:hypothetical protein
MCSYGLKCSFVASGTDMPFAAWMGKITNKIKQNIEQLFDAYPSVSEACRKIGSSRFSNEEMQLVPRHSTQYVIRKRQQNIRTETFHYRPWYCNGALCLRTGLNCLGTGSNWRPLTTVMNLRDQDHWEASSNSGTPKTCSGNTFVCLSRNQLVRRQVVCQLHEIWG